ncbi:MAG TPA: hypothetical protein VNT30_14145 [Stellaceae bacterium]|nr:hypothetical protein [Stellaceae bacterium]
MTSLAETIDRTLANIGNDPRDLLLDTLDGFEALGLPDEERLSAIATAIGTSAVTNHARHIRVYLDAIQVWALEVAVGRSPPPARLNTVANPARSALGAEVLITGADTLLDSLRSQNVNLQDRLVTELALYTRLIGQHDANCILLTLRSVADAIHRPDFFPGTHISVLLRDTRMLTREQSLADMPVRGTA